MYLCLRFRSTAKKYSQKLRNINHKPVEQQGGCVSNEFLHSYEKQLPKYKRRGLRELGSFILAFITFVSFYFALKTELNFNWISNEILLSGALIFQILVLMSFIVYRELNKKHRYAEAIFYISHTSQLIKDFLRLYRSGNVDKSELKSLHDKIVNNVANCFSIIKGVKCSVCIKNIVDDSNDLICVARDSHSSRRYKEDDSSNMSKNMAENSGFKCFLDLKTSYVRYYLNNNLKQSWLGGKYDNNALSCVAKPDVNKFFMFSYVSKWKLKYNSTLICPIRHISADEDVEAHYIGFLCVDSESKNIFNDKIDPELLFCFSNQLYLLNTEVSHINLLLENPPSFS